MIFRGGHPYPSTMTWWFSDEATLAPRNYLTPGPSKLEEVVDPGSALPRGPLPRLNLDLGSGSRFMVVDPGVYYQGPLPSPILTVHAIHLIVYYELMISRGGPPCYGNTWWFSEVGTLYLSTMSWWFTFYGMIWWFSEVGTPFYLLWVERIWAAFLNICTMWDFPLLIRVDNVEFINNHYLSRSPLSAETVF